MSSKFERIMAISVSQGWMKSQFLQILKSQNLAQFLGSMLPQYMAFCVSLCVSVSKKFVCPFVGLHCGCVPPL